MSTDVRHTRTLSDHVAEEIRVQLARQRMSGRQLARKLGVSPNWVSLRTSGSQPIDFNDAERIADALGVALVELLPADRRSGPVTERYLPGERVLATIGALDDARIKRPPMPRRPARRRPPAGAGSIRPATPVPV